jgi:protein subunit release factor A
MSEFAAENLRIETTNLGGRPSPAIGIPSNSFLSPRGRFHVRAIHLPTGLSAEATGDGQVPARDEALRRLREKLADGA